MISEDLISDVMQLLETFLTDQNISHQHFSLKNFIFKQHMFTMLHIYSEQRNRQTSKATQSHQSKAYLIT